MAAPRLRPAPELLLEVDGHDRKQIEVELAYPVERGEPVTYQADLYLFVPRNVGIHHGNYDRAAFYEDLRAYLRLDSRPLTLAQLADETCAESPLRELGAAITLVERDPTVRPPRPIAALVRLFGHAFRQSLQAARQELQRAFEARAAALALSAVTPAPAAGLLEQLTSLCCDAELSLRRFRALRRRFAALRGARPPSVAVAFEHIDEYTSAFFLDELSQLSERLEAQAELHDGTCLVAEALLILSRHARAVAHARRLEGFASAHPRDPRSQEFYTYRRGIIKKSLQQTFYLETRALRRDPLLRNAVAMVAAGLAAIWSLAASAPTLLAQLSARTQLGVLALAVIAYALKDRIKEVSRAYLLRRLWAFDHDTRIVGEGLVQLGLAGVDGRARERMTWQTPAEVPEALLALRSHPRTVAGSEILGEEVIFYQRSLTLRDQGVGDAAGSPLRPDGATVRDILRLNLSDFMDRLDDPQERVSFYDLGRDRLSRVDTPKVYHLNLLLRVSASREREPRRQLLLTRHRVILNQDRIVRVEPVSTESSP